MAITDNILSSVVKAIWEEFHSDFGDDMDIVKGTLTQGFSPNSFTVRCINPDIKKDLDILYQTNFTVSICYFPDETLNQTQIDSNFYDVTERLNSIFETSEVNENLSIHGTNIDKTISDENVLVYVISFNTRMTKEEEHEREMKELVINQEVK